MQFRSDLIKSEARFMETSDSSMILFLQAWEDIFMTNVSYSL